MATLLSTNLPKKKPSVLKRIRQTERRTAVNKNNRSRLRTEIKKLRKAIDAGKAEDAKTLLRPTLRTIDRMIQKGILRANTASRYKSRLTRSYNALAQKSA